MALFRKEVHKFKRWAAGYSRAGQFGEWECDYEEWPDLYSAVLEFLASIPASKWSADEIEDLLYVIARDNETEHLAEKIAEEPERLLLLARESLSSQERDAKWQLAVQLGSLANHKEAAERLLLSLVNDPDEYVSRRALLALASVHSSHTEALAERAWESGHEYQRMAALSSLQEVSSPKLAFFIEEALKDGRKYLVQAAEKLRH